MLRKILRTILSSAIFLLAACNSENKELFVDPETSVVSEELSNQHATAFAEDSTGYIWIGTERGLNRYNSKNFHHYYYNYNDSASIPSNNILCLFIDSKGRLWVGTDNGLCYYSDKDDFHRINCDQKYAIVHQIWENEGKRLGITVFQPRLKVCTFARTNYYEYGKQRQVQESP